MLIVGAGVLIGTRLSFPSLISVARILADFARYFCSCDWSERSEASTQSALATGSRTGNLVSDDVCAGQAPGGEVRLLLSLLATHTLALAYSSPFLRFLRFKDQGESRRVLRLSVGLQLNHLDCLPQSSSSGRERAPSNPQQAAHLDRPSLRAALEDKSRSRTSTRQRRATTDRSSRRSYGLCAQDGHGLLTTLPFSLLPPQASGVSRNLASTALCTVDEAEFRPLAWTGGSSKNAIERGHSRASLCAAINSHSRTRPSLSTSFKSNPRKPEQISLCSLGPCSDNSPDPICPTQASSSSASFIPRPRS